ncbi:MAG TPA: DUF6655 family protein [Pirellulales bacterium]|jgi:hypothetical protein|nr:DUF6655 family protein [Pirellulales bacterium]
MRLFRLLILSTLALAAGCGTTRWSDTARTATEQLILSTAIDRAIDNIDFRPLTGRYVFLDQSYLDCVDKGYVISTLRQHMLSEGCVLTADAASADYVVEVRSGAIGTDHHDVLIGVPAISMPGAGVTGVPSAIPEIPFAKTTAQKGIAKIACFAYNRETGQAVWQSGVFPVVATAKDSWFLGTGPFQRGTIYDGTHFAGSHFLFMRKAKTSPVRTPDVPLAAQAVFSERPALVRRKLPPAGANQAPKSAANFGTNAPPPVTGTAGPSLSGNGPAGAPAGGSPTNAGTSTGLPAGQVVRLPSLGQPPASGGIGGSGGLSLNPNSWLRLK